MYVGKVEHGLCAELALCEVCFEIESVAPRVIIPAQAVGEVERVGTISLLVAEVFVVCYLPFGHRRQILAKGMASHQFGFGREMVSGGVVVLTVGLRRSAQEILVQARRFAVALLVVVSQRCRCPKFGFAKNGAELCLEVCRESFLCSQ